MKYLLYCLSHFFLLFIKQVFNLEWKSWNEFEKKMIFLKCCCKKTQLNLDDCFSLLQAYCNWYFSLTLRCTSKGPTNLHQCSSRLHKNVISYDWDYFQFMKEVYKYVFIFLSEITITFLITHIFNYRLWVHLDYDYKFSVWLLLCNYSSTITILLH